MIPDMSLVLFRPRWDEVRHTLSNISAISGDFNTLHILLSGSSEDLTRLRSLLSEIDLESQVRIIHRWDNLGFASGHNELLRQAFANEAKCCLIVNPDIEISPGALGSLVEQASSILNDQLVAPALSSNWDGVKVVDSLGIRWTSDGRHFDAHQGDPWSQDSVGIKRVSGVTGACLLVSRDVHDALVARCGHFFDDAFLAYREDAELGIRAGLVGIASSIVVMDGFSHERHVRGAARGRALPDLLGVRNRFLLRWKLGSDRPSRGPLALVRDVVVVFAACTVERRSLEGLGSAVAMRRTMIYSRRRYRAWRARS